MSVGVPVVGTDHGNTPEFLRAGAGLLVPPGDAAALAAAIGRLLSEPALRAALVAAARQRVATEHDLGRTLPAMLEALVAP